MVDRELAVSEDDLVRLARQAHSNWLELMEQRGYHPSCFCCFFGTGCSKCNPDMVPFDDLPSEVREGYLSRVRSMEESLADLGYLILGPGSFEVAEPDQALKDEIEMVGPSDSDGFGLRRLPKAVSTYRRP